MAVQATAEPGVRARSTVAIARAERILAPEGPLTPYVYPEGKVEYRIVKRLLDEAVAAAVGAEDAESAWRELITPNDRVGIQIDVGPLPVHDEVLEAVILSVMATGVPLRHIVIYSGEEAALFRAGFDISGRTPGATVMAADVEGYRRGTSRIVLDHTTKIINVARLRVDDRVGMHAAIANCLSSVPNVDRERLRRNPEMLAEAAANASLRRSAVLHVIDALRPGWAHDGEDGSLQTWLYRGLIVSEDPVAADTVAHAILLEKVREETGADQLEPPVLYLEPAASEFRLGNADPERIDTICIGP